MQMRPGWEGDPGEIQAHGPGFTVRTYAVRRLVRELRPDTLLDIGCGRGNVTRLVAPYARHTLAVEISAEAARLARRTLAECPRTDVLAADVLALGGGYGSPLTGRFDLVLLSEVLEHLDDDRAALEACYALLRPGGWLLVTVPAHPHLWTEMDELIGHRRRYTRAGLSGRLEDARFQVERLLSWGFPLSGWFVQRGQRLRARRLRVSANGSASLGLPGHLLRVALLFFQAVARLEFLFSSLDRGIGYVALARRPEQGEPTIRR